MIAEIPVGSTSDINKIFPMIAPTIMATTTATASPIAMTPVASVPGPTPAVSTANLRGKVRRTTPFGKLCFLAISSVRACNTVWIPRSHSRVLVSSSDLEAGEAIQPWASRSM